VIVASTTLTANVTNCPGNGLVIGAANVTLNLNGHTISGTGLGVGVLGTYTGFTVTNGSIEGFATGVSIDCFNGPCTFTTNGVPLPVNTVRSLRIFNNGDGILEFDAGSTVIAHNVIHNNTGYCAVCLFLDQQGNVSANQIYANAGIGIARTVDSYGEISGNLIRNNGSTGISLVETGGAVTNNQVLNNNGDGIYTADLEGDFFRAYRITSNTADGNAGHGIVALDEDDNTSTLPSVEDGGGNVATENGLNPQCINIVCAARR
jgi:hypothetical protein